MKVSKQSLSDWDVMDNGKRVAWISKTKNGYYVKFTDIADRYFYPTFAEAKRFATTCW